jgi:hypothetical protein
MQWANMVDVEHFRTIPRYLEQQGWIEDADAEYGVFVVTASGIAEAIKLLPVRLAHRSPWVRGSRLLLVRRWGRCFHVIGRSGFLPHRRLSARPWRRQNTYRSRQLKAKVFRGRWVRGRGPDALLSSARWLAYSSSRATGPHSWYRSRVVWQWPSSSW